jgi:hypothetical protein
MTGNAAFVDDGEAEAAIAHGLNMAGQRGEGITQGADGILNLGLGIHHY